MLKKTDKQPGISAQVATNNLSSSITFEFQDTFLGHLFSLSSTCHRVSEDKPSCFSYSFHAALNVPF